MYMRNTKCRAKIKVLNRTLKYQVSHTLNVLLFINLMRTLLQDSLNKSNNHYILLGQAPAKTPTFPMIYALNNKQVMPSGSRVIIQKKYAEQSNWIENRFRGIGYENNQKINNRAVGKLRSGAGFVQLSHPTFIISVMIAKLNKACSHSKATALSLLNKGNLGFSSVTN